MALHLHFGDHLDALLPELVTDLSRVWSDPMQAPRMVVPSPSTGNWLQLRLTEKMQALANLSMLTLERFLWDILNPPPEKRLLGASAVTQVLIVLLRNQVGSLSPEFTPVREYLKTSANDIDENKLQQLAGRLATLLCEYEYNRPPVWNPATQTWLSNTGIDSAWLNGADFFPQADSGTEIWQRTLYCDLFNSVNGKFASLSGQIWKTLPQLYRTTLEKNPHWVPVDQTPAFLVQVNKISHFHRNMLLELSRHLEISVYLTNPCAEFWEDVADTRAGRSQRKWNEINSKINKLSSADYQKENLQCITGFLPSDEKDNRLLQLWGKTGKENIALWCQAANYDFSYQADEEPFSELNLLQQVQQKIRMRMPVQDLILRPEDASLRIFSAPTRLREVENLRTRILELLRSDAQLRLDEIAIYVTDIQIYQSVLEQVLGAYETGSAAHLPYSILGRSASESLVAQGVRDLLAVWGGDFSRAAVFRVLRNPLIHTQLRVKRSEVLAWESWAAQMEIFRGFGREQLAVNGDGNAASDEHTFRWGISRLLLGALASGPVDLGLRTRSAEQILGVRGFRDFETSDSRSVLNFIKAVERLAEQESRLRTNSSMDLTEQWQWLTKCLEEWLAPFMKADGWNADLEKRCWKIFLESLESVQLQHSIAGRHERMDVAELLATLRSLTPQEGPEAAKGWHGVLTIAPLRSGHILPHRHVFILGLDGNLFPGVRTPVPLDLISSQRILGDADSVQDNRFSFLELLHAARESLNFSYLAKDIQKDAALLPSSVLLELESVLMEGGCSEEQIRHEIPLLQRDATSSVPDPYQIALHAVAASVNDSGERALHRLPARLDMQSNQTKNNLRVNGSSISTFLSNPLEYHLKERLNWKREEESGTLQIRDEHLTLSSLERSAFFSWFLHWVLEQPLLRQVDKKENYSEILQTLQRSAAEWINQLRFTGALPQGWFGSAESQKLRNLTEAILRSFILFCQSNRNLGIHLTDHVTHYAWATQHNDGESRDFRNISLNSEVDVEIQAAIPHVLVNRSSGVIWLVHCGSLLDTKGNPRPESFLKPLLHSALIKTGGWQGKVFLLSVDTKQGQCRSFEMTENSQSLEEWLRLLADQMLIARNGEHLPLTDVAENWSILDQENSPESIQEFWNAMSEALESRDAFGAYRCYTEDWELGEPRDSFASDPERLADLVRMRYTWIFRCLGIDRADSGDNT